MSPEVGALIYEVRDRRDAGSSALRAVLTRNKEEHNQAACCVEPHGWCVVTSIGLKHQFSYDRAVLLIQATTVRISNSRKP